MTTRPTFFFAPDGAGEPTLWEPTDGEPIALAMRCEIHPRLWGELERLYATEGGAAYLPEHEVRVRTTGYGGHVTYCSCGHDGDYVDHLRLLLGGAA